MVGGVSLMQSGCLPSANKSAKTPFDQVESDFVPARTMQSSMIAHVQYPALREEVSDLQYIWGVKGYSPL